MRLHVIRVELDRLAQVRHRLGHPPGRQQEAPQVVVRLRVVLLQRQRTLVFEHRRLVVARHGERGAQVEVRRRGPGLEVRRSPEMPRGVQRPVQVEIQLGNAVVQRCAVGLRLQPSLVSDGVLGHHLRTELRVQRLQVLLVPRQHLNPQVAHLVGRALPPVDPFWRLVRIARVLRRIVVAVAHLQPRALRQPERRDIAEHVLPAEVPVADVDQRTHRAVGQVGEADHLFRAVVRVRLHGLHFDIDRGDERVGDDVVLLARRDVDALAAQPQHRRRPLRRVATEVEADRRLHHFFLAAWLHVQFDDEVGVRLEAPGEPLGQQRRHLRRRPAEEVPIRIDRGVGDEAGVPGLRIGLVERARRIGVIDADVRVMYHARVARLELHAAHELQVVDWQLDDEHTEDVGAVGLQREFRRGHHEVGRAQLPAVGPLRRCRRIGRIPLERPIGTPPLQHIELDRRQARLVQELAAVVAVGLPRRHIAALRHGGDLTRVHTRVGVADQAERPGAAGAMTDAALGVDDRRHVARERDRCGRLRGNRRRERGERPYRERKSGRPHGAKSAM